MSRVITVQGVSLRHPEGCNRMRKGGCESSKVQYHKSRPEVSIIGVSDEASLLAPAAVDSSSSAAPQPGSPGPAPRDT